MIEDLEGAAAGSTSGLVMPVSQDGAAAPISLNLPGPIRTQASRTRPIAGISVSDPGATGAGAKVTVVITDTYGLLIDRPRYGVTAQGSGTDKLTLSGTLAGVNAELALLQYTVALGVSESDTISFAVTDTLGHSANGTIAVTINQPTFVTVPAAPTVTSGVATRISGISIADGDAISMHETVTAVLTDNLGALSVTKEAGVTIRGEGSKDLLVQGTLTQVNNELATLTYTATLTGGASTATGTILIRSGDTRGGGNSNTLSMTIDAAQAGAAGPDRSASLFGQYAAAGPGMHAGVLVTGAAVADPAMRAFEIAAGHR